MSNELVPMSVNDVMSLGNVFVQSRFFADVRDASQAIVKILAGRELGIAPIAAMTGIHIIQGKPTLSANLIASKIKASDKYDYRVKIQNDAECTIEFSQRNGNGWESIGISTFTLNDARRAGTKNLDKFPRNMLFARALSNGARWYCPDAFAGIVVYAPEDFDLPVMAVEQPTTNTIEQLIEQYGVENVMAQTSGVLPETAEDLHKLEQVLAAME